VLAVVAVVCLAACSGQSPPSAVANLMPKAKHRPAPAPPKRGPTVEELTVGMVEAVSLAKSSVPVGMKFQVSERPAVGKALDVEVALLPQEEADSATLKVSGSDGLQMTADATSLQIPSIEAGRAYKESFTVTPISEGIQVLNVTVALTRDESTESRSFSVPLIIPPPATASTPPAKHPGS
jgi:hypothetical protein